MLLTNPRTGRTLPVIEQRDDGWPICPFCDNDELWSDMMPAQADAIAGCYVCGPLITEPADRG